MPLLRRIVSMASATKLRLVQDSAERPTTKNILMAWHHIDFDIELPAEMRRCPRGRIGPGPRRIVDKLIRDEQNDASRHDNRVVDDQIRPVMMSLDSE